MDARGPGIDANVYPCATLFGPVMAKVASTGPVALSAKTDAGATPTAVGEALHAALWAMRTESTRALVEAGITGPQTGVLWFLHEYKALSMARLAELQGTTAANMTGMVGRLERDGLVRRRAHPTDRRVQIIELTAEGLARTRKARKAVDRAMAHLFQETTQADLEVVLRVLRQVRQRVDSENPPA
ncbi:MAG: MarR family transcriptional regulator, organic hydroperoxide resistance regulator [Thermoplasmata archaeon]|nr:MarR family transcriptional regulator, organic hydroperoxide resistance regulator [Thermoplasmata archaeon]